MGAGRSSYHWIQNINSSFITRISLRNTHFSCALIGLSFSITIGGLVSPCQQLQFHQQLKSLYQLQMQKKKLNQEELNQKRRVEEVWNEIKGFLQSQKKGRSSLFQAHHLSLSLSTHATRAYGLIQTHIYDQRQANHTYSRG